MTQVLGLPLNQAGRMIRFFFRKWVKPGAGGFFWLELILTYDAGPPGGYYIPAFFIGACLGRGTCTLAHQLGLVATVHPGIYAMVGSAAVMAGMCRVHVSLVVIMLL